MDSLNWSKQNAKRVRKIADRVINGEMVFDEQDLCKLYHYCETMVSDLSKERDIKRLQKLKKILTEANRKGNS